MIKGLWRNRHMCGAMFWFAMIVPTLVWWKQSVFLLLLNALYTTVKTDLGLHHSLRAQKEAEKGNAETDHQD